MRNALHLPMLILTWRNSHMKRLLSGNEAIARGAWEAGVLVASGYPGTPSTEILETFAQFPGVYAEWAPNEKVALDVAIGAAYAGRRALATMKHVGVNVAADSLFYASMTGAEAGLVIVSADDPSMHSSQNEQDNRQYAKFARIPCLEPADSQEAKDFTLAAYELSEKFDTPVLLRVTTRICHTSTLVGLDTQRGHPDLPESYPRNPSKYVMIPGNARKRHPVIEERIKNIALDAESYSLNNIEERSESLGIITAGVAYQYAREVFPEASILKLGMVYPLPRDMILNFSKGVKRVIVLEELDPFIEEQVGMMGVRLFSKTDKDGNNGNYENGKSIFPLLGELDPGIVRTSAEEAGLLPEEKEKINNSPMDDLPMRPPVLCPGCPHRSTFYPLHKLGLPINGDIGCYTLGVVPPLSAIDTCGCMGASIGVAHGAAIAGDNERHIAIIGDSTFFHTGIPALINVAYNKSNVITIILDNRTTGMTGHQENPGTGRTLQGLETVEVDIETLVRSIGIQKVKTVDGYDTKEIERILKAWVKMDEPAVLIAKHECVLLPSERRQWVPLDILSEDCNGCGLCFRIGCPAIFESDEFDPKTSRPLAEIDPRLCTGCEICAQLCPRDAILFRDQISVEGELT
jgi:indolepyruvate ferredoxin oxidoreductase alpha subunit